MGGRLRRAATVLPIYSIVTSLVRLPSLTVQVTGRPATAMDRHSLLDSDGDGDRMPPNPNVFDDEYETDAASIELEHRPGEGQTAGQEPGMSSASQPRSTSQSRADRRSQHAKEAAEGNSQQRPWRVSIFSSSLKTKRSP